MYLCALLAVLLLGSLMTACTPTAQLATPNELTNVNLNVKVEYKTYIRVDEVLDGIVNENNGLL